MLTIEDIIRAHQYEFWDLSIAPDDQDALVVFGNFDVPYKNHEPRQMARSLWRISLTDGAMLPLAPKEEDAHSPCWSPDGMQYAYISRRTGQPQIWVAGRDAPDPQPITDTVFAAGHPFEGSRLHWSQDGQHIAYTVLPNGGRSHIVRALYRDQGLAYLLPGTGTDIVVHHPSIDSKRENHWGKPATLVGEVHLVHPNGEGHRRLAVWTGVEVDLCGWLPDGKRLLVKVGQGLDEVVVANEKVRRVFEGPFDLVDCSQARTRLAWIEDNHIRVGTLNKGALEEDLSCPVSGYEIRLGAWSPNGKRLYGSASEGVSAFLFSVNLDGEMQRLTAGGKAALPLLPRSLQKGDGVLFPYQSPTEPPELWLSKAGNTPHQVTSINASIRSKLPPVRIVQYPSANWTIEAFLVLPPQYKPGQKHPALVYLHGGPEGCLKASFTDLNQARGTSAAFLLASQGYVVLLPNFRGSSGYGPDFESELAAYNLVKKPFEDVVAGVNYLVDEGLADPDQLGVYGSSYGAWLSAWTVSQTHRFKAAVCSFGVYDLLREDRVGGQACYAAAPNRQDGTDPEALWRQPEVFRNFSPMEHIATMRTPTLIFETSGERTTAAGHQAGMFYNGLCALGVEAYLIYYPEASHGVGWTDTYKRDYMQRVVAWFDHCVREQALPDWFVQGMPAPE